MPRQPKWIVCPGCKRFSCHYGQGLCFRCYRKKRYWKKRKRYEEGGTEIMGFKWG